MPINVCQRIPPVKVNKIIFNWKFKASLALSLASWSSVRRSTAIGKPITTTDQLTRADAWQDARNSFLFVISFILSDPEGVTDHSMQGVMRALETTKFIYNRNLTKSTSHSSNASSVPLGYDRATTSSNGCIRPCSGLRLDEPAKARAERGVAISRIRISS